MTTWFSTVARRLPMLVTCLGVAACNSGSAVEVDARVDAPPYEALDIERVGHVDLDMDENLGLTVVGNHAYVGHRHQGTIDIVDISNPAAPARVGEIDAGFDAAELRAIGDLKRLYVLVPPAELVAYDLTEPATPQRMGSISVPNVIGHEFFLWRDPIAPSRVLAVLTDVSTTGGFVVFDVSDPMAMTIHHRQVLTPLHSISLSQDGTRMYSSYVSGHIGVMDSTNVVAPGTALPATSVAKTRVSDCTSQSPTCIAHSMVKVPGRALAAVTYENAMCPKGWLDIVDLTDETTPTRLGTWRHPNWMVCGTAEPDLGMFGYGPHNPTATTNLVLVSWYRAGFLIIDVSDATAPVEVGRFVPNAAPGSLLAWGRVASVSYPIIKDGLIYVVDGRNGLDVLRYVGPHHDEVDAAAFLDGSSSL